jgi:hypothetical protein
MRVFVSIINFFAVTFCVIALSAASSAQSTVETATAKHPEITQTGNVMHLAVTGARPLADAVDALQGEYGWHINYEDPQFISKLDVTESTDVRYANAASGTRPHTPNGGAFSVDFPAGMGSKAPDPASTLKIVIDAYNKSSNPGQFEVRAQGQYFDVVGISAHNDAGAIQQQHSPLDELITVSSAEQPAIDAVISICDQISKLGATVNLGVYPRSALSRPISLVVTKLPAREALSRIASAAVGEGGRTMCWRLLYDPDSKSYFINLHMQK